MPAQLILDDLQLAPRSHRISLRMEQGQSLALVGSAQSGKSWLLNILAGLAKAPSGSVRASGTHGRSFGRRRSRKDTPQTLARTAAGGSSERAAQALSCLGLWDARTTQMGSLSSSQVAALELLEPLASNSEIMLVDQQFDHLDPLVLVSTMDLVRQRLVEGAILVAATHRPDLLPQFDGIVVLHRGRVKFTGTLDDLLAKDPDGEMEVALKASRSNSEVIKPFRMYLKEERDNRLVLRADHDMDLAAKLVLEGYSDVEAVTIKRSTLEGALRALLHTR